MIKDVRPNPELEGTEGYTYNFLRMILVIMKLDCLVKCLPLLLSMDAVESRLLSVQCPEI